ncbi:MAG: diaminopimelate epimerase [Pseudomonadota bacterium]
MGKLEAPMELNFDKMEGCGNDFVVLDLLERPHGPLLLSPSLIQGLADRRLGIGFDQLLLVERTASGAEPTAEFRIYNADGSAAGQCGNGARCVAALLHERHDFPGEFTIGSPAGTIRARIEQGRVSVSMGVPEFAPAMVPIAAKPGPNGGYRLDVANETVTLGAVSMGNPHGVLFVEDVDDAPVEQLGPAIQQLDAFPKGVNVGFLQPLTDHRGRLRVFERGVGETLACGSGACAAAVVGLRVGKFVGGVVRLALRGGELVISWPGEGHPVWLEGATRWVFRGQVTV